MTELYNKAEAFGLAAHAAIGQKRKYTDEPYFIHPLEVAATVKRHGGTEEMIAAALLHDVVEDTQIEPYHIATVISASVARLVTELTDVSRPEDGNRAMRKAIDRNHLASASAEAQTIKCADLISNTASIAKHDRKFARVYLKEKEALLDAMTKALPAIRDEARAVLLAAKMDLEENGV